MDSKEVIAQGGIEKIGLKDSFLKLTLPNGEKKILEKAPLIFGYCHAGLPIPFGYL